MALPRPLRRDHAEDEWVEATREGVKLANARGVGAIHDKDGWLGAPRHLPAAPRRGGLTLRVWRSIPHESVDRARELAPALAASATTTSGSAT